MNHRKRSAGFTLIELIVVIVISGVVTTIGVWMFFVMFDTWAITRDRAELDHVAANVFSLMRQDFTEIASPRLTGLGVSGESQRTSGNVELANDRITLPVMVEGPDGVRSLQTVVYEVTDRKPAAGDLTRSSMNAATPKDQPHRLIAGGGVLRFAVEYNDAKGQWVSGWQAPELPRAIRVSLTLTNPEAPRGQVSHKAEFPVHVN